MKEVYVVYGRKQWGEISYLLSKDYRFDESKIYGVFTSFDTALEAFKKCVDEAREYICWENTPTFMCFSPDKLEQYQEVELFSNYNLDVMPDEDFDEDACTVDDPDIGWECCIGTDSASWIMTSNLGGEYDYMIFPSLFIKKIVVEGEF
jgi:hypothetical protein